MNSMLVSSQRGNVLAAVVFNLCLLLSAPLTAAPFAGRITFTQPSGSVVELWGRGDEFSAVFETLDGYSVVYDQALRAYCYAQLSPDGATLLSTGTEVQSTTGTALGLTRHLRINGTALRQQINSRFARWDNVVKMSSRWSALKARSQSGPTQNAPPATTTTGTKVGLCLLIEFTDDPATIPQATVEEYCNGDNFTQFGNNGSVKKYFQDVSNGLLTYSNVVTVYITAPKPKTFYNDTTKDCGDQANILITDAIATMKALPNYTTQILPAFNSLTVDASKQVIACNVFYTGGNGNVWGYGLWPHSWGLYNAGAQELSAGGKKVFLYQISDMGSQLTIGTFCHENGHLLCDYPDLYDYNYVSSGVGDWCLMASGNYGGNGCNPVEVCAYLRRASGWATTTELNSSSSMMATVSELPGADFNHFYRYVKPGDATEYFIMECRYPSGRDGAVPGGGVAVWHIDEKGDNSSVNLSTNSTHTNYEATLVQADNLWDLEHNRNDGNAADLYCLGNTTSGYSNRFSDFTTPAAKWWNGTASGLVLRNFSAASNTMTFYVGAEPSVPAIVTQPQSLTLGVGQTATFTVTATGAAPLSYQWRFNGSPIAGATDTSYILSNLQTNHAGAYSVVISNSLGSATSSNAILTIVNGPSGLIAQWNFNSKVPDSSSTTGSSTPSYGAGTASTIGNASATFATGSTSDPAASDNSGWNTTGYPSQGSGNKSAGVQFNVSTVGQENIVVRWDQRASNSGSKYSRLQYTTDGTTFTDFPTPVIMSLANIFEPKTNNLSAIAGVQNNPLFAFRIVSEWQSTAIGSGSAQYLTASTSSYSSGGTLRFDMVTVSGTAIQAAGQALLSASGLDANGRFQFSVAGSTGFNYAVEASTNLSLWTRLLTNTPPFNFTDTTSPAPLQRFYRAVVVP